MNKEQIIANAKAEAASMQAATTYDLVLTIKVPVTIHANPSDPNQGFNGAGLAMCKIQQLLNQDGWRDGRYPLQREVLTESVQGLVKDAIHEYLSDYWRSQHNEMVQLSDTYSSNLGHMMACVDSKRFSVWAKSEIEFTEIERRKPIEETE